MNTTSQDHGRADGTSGTPASTLGTVAGWVLIVLGVLNTVLAVMSMSTDVINLNASAQGGLLVAGVVTIAAGELVRRGSRLALYVCLTVFGSLLFLELTTRSPDDDTSAVPRLVVLSLVTVLLAAAAVVGRRR